VIVRLVLAARRLRLVPQLRYCRDQPRRVLGGDRNALARVGQTLLADRTGDAPVLVGRDAGGLRQPEILRPELFQPLDDLVHGRL